MTDILLISRNAMMMEGRAMETAEEASKALAQLRDLLAKAGAVINGRLNYQVLFNTLFER